jgi:hypothetical protein
MHFSARQSKATNPPSHDEASRSLTRPVPSKHPQNHPLLELQRAIGNQSTERLLRARLEGSTSVPPIVHEALQFPGEPLDSTTRVSMAQGLGHDFRKVRIHADEQAAESASALNARAYTVGPHIVFGRGQYATETREGKKLLAHELTHVIQQKTSQGGLPNELRVSSSRSDHEYEAETVAENLIREQSTTRISVMSAEPQIQRQIQPEDVSDEMAGVMMRVSDSATVGSIQLVAGDLVQVVNWSYTTDTVQVRLMRPFVGPQPVLDISKRLLRPIAPGTPGIAPYGAGIDQVIGDLEQGDQRIAAEQARRGGPRPGEIPRVEGLQRNRMRLLNRRLIQEQMFNRFDPVIRQWTDYYNPLFGYTGENALDPNLVKSMLFQESQMGTAGQHLEAAPRWPVRARFNIGQVIDSAAAALLVMMREMQPGLITAYHLDHIEDEVSRAQRDLRNLRNVQKPSPAEQARLTQLSNVERQAQSWGLSFGETFMWSYKAPGQSQGFFEAVEDFFTSGGGTPLNEQYEFWIRAAIRWLFEKRRSVRSWAEAIRAYNGSGARARHYRDAVQGRAQSATEAQRTGRKFVPSRI